MPDGQSYATDMPEFGQYSPETQKCIEFIFEYKKHIFFLIISLPTRITQATISSKTPHETNGLYTGKDI